MIENTARLIYSYTSRVKEILQLLNFGRPDIRSIDKRLSHMYNLTNDLVAVAVEVIVTALTHRSRHIQKCLNMLNTGSTDYCQYFILIIFRIMSLFNSRDGALV